MCREFELACHKDEKIGFRDVYGRMRWNDYSPTITGGCLNPSKGRFFIPKRIGQSAPGRPHCCRRSPELTGSRQRYPKRRLH